jgi:hypothetical protein
MDLNAPPADVDTPLLSTIAPTPASGDTVRLCGAELAARFQTADGRVGVAPSASVSVKGLGTHDTGTDLIDLDPRGTTGSGTVSAVLGGARASVDVTFTDVSSCF